MTDVPPDFPWIDPADTGYEVEPYDPADEAPPGDVGEVADCAGEGDDDG